MPLYEFECGACQKSFELLVRSSRWQGAACPHCRSTKLTKKLSVFAQRTVADSVPPPSCPANPRGCAHCGPHHRH